MSADSGADVRLAERKQMSVLIVRDFANAMAETKQMPAICAHRMRQKVRNVPLRPDNRRKMEFSPPKTHSKFFLKWMGK